MVEVWGYDVYSILGVVPCCQSSLIHTHTHTHTHTHSHHPGEEEHAPEHQPRHTKAETGNVSMQHVLEDISVHAYTVPHLL